MITVRNQIPADAGGNMSKMACVIELNTEAGESSGLALPKTTAQALHRTLKELPLVLAQKKAALPPEELAGDDHLSIDAAIGMPGFPPMAVAFCADHGMVLQMMITQGSEITEFEGIDAHVSVMELAMIFGVLEPAEVPEFLDQLEACAEKAED